MRPKTIFVAALLVVALLTSHKPIGQFLENSGHWIHETGQVIKTGKTNGS